ncbi:MAG: polynucleotide adenylyltransferase [Syntrophomonadaceae bacterium]|nr:polynucleotide adenylyltransferase [Syntrophomonadaceae bacterium]
MKIEMPEDVKLILNILQTKGYQAFVYGACVRDSLLGIKPISWDISTNALPPEIILLFDDKNGFTAIPVIHDYSTVLLIYQGESYRASTFRTAEERRFSDDIHEDLKHNDFTLNSIAYNQDGLVDPFSGVSDIENKIIRCAGNPLEKINEDPVRILRAVRFEAQLGFVIDDSIIRIIHALKDSISFDNSEKMCNELTQIFLTEKPSLSIRRLLDLGLLTHLIPELLPAIGFDTHSSFHDKDVFEHSMAVLDYTKPNLSLRLAALFHDIDKPNCLTLDDDGQGHCYGHASSSSQVAGNVLARLCFDQKTINSVVSLIKEHMNNYKSISELSLKRLIRRVGPENLDNLFELQIADIKGSELSGRDSSWIMSVRNKCFEVLSRRDPLTTNDLAINGYDLMGLYPSGKEMGEALEYLLDRVVDDPSLNETEKLMAILKAKQ